MASFFSKKPKHKMSFDVEFSGTTEAAESHKKNIETLLLNANEEEMRILAAVVKNPIVRKIAIEKAKEHLGI